MSGKPQHGLSRTPEYSAWQQMRLRCTKPEHRAFPDYGGRGITVCDQWMNSVEAFFADMGPKPSPKHELDRIDNNKGYSPENCRWVLRTVNCRNRRSNRQITYRGQTKTIAEWSDDLSIPRDTIAKRLSSGWSAEKALSTPVRSKSANGEAKSPLGNCIDCSKPRIWGIRCKSCENRRRHKAKLAHEPKLEATA